MKHLFNKTTSKAYIAVALLSLFSATGHAQVTPAYVDFDAYESLVSEVKQHRKTRMLTAQEFIATSKEEKVIMLDTRSDSMYNAVHVKGAVHLNFSDFTQDNLARIIPSGDYKVLIYCNNNFNTKLSPTAITLPNFERYFVTKGVTPKMSAQLIFESKRKSPVKKAKVKAKSGPHNSAIEPEIEIPLTAKPLTLALNIPTYINLYGYGYRNVYELSELVNTYDNTFEFEGTAVKK